MMATEEEIRAEMERLEKFKERARTLGTETASEVEALLRDGVKPTYGHARTLASCVFLLATSALYVAPDARPTKSEVDAIWKDVLGLAALARCNFDEHDHVSVEDFQQARFTLEPFRADDDNGAISLDAAKCSAVSLAVFGERVSFAPFAAREKVIERDGTDAWVLAALGWDVMRCWKVLPVGEHPDPPVDFYIRPDEDWVSTARAQQVFNAIRNAGGPPTFNPN